MGSYLLPAPSQLQVLRVPGWALPGRPPNTPNPAPSLAVPETQTRCGSAEPPAGAGNRQGWVARAAPGRGAAVAPSVPGLWRLPCGTGAGEGPGRPRGAFGIGGDRQPGTLPRRWWRAWGCPLGRQGPPGSAVVSSSSNETNRQQLKTKRKRSPRGMSRAGDRGTYLLELGARKGRAKIMETYK